MRWLVDEFFLPLFLAVDGRAARLAMLLESLERIIAEPAVNFLPGVSEATASVPRRRTFNPKVSGGRAARNSQHAYSLTK